MKEIRIVIEQTVYGWEAAIYADPGPLSNCERAAYGYGASREDAILDAVDAWREMRRALQE